VDSGATGEINMMQKKCRSTRWLSLAVALIAAAVLGGCLGLLGPRSVEIPLQRLQASLDKKFPLTQRPLALIDIQLSNPKLALQPNTNRMSATMDASVAPVFTSRIWRGTFTLSGLLQLDANRRAVMLAQPQIDQIALEGIDPALSAQVARGAGILAAQILRDTPLYTFGPDDFRYGGSNFVPTRITTTASGLVVTFDPAK
jgi:hypothetical protein